MPLEAEPGEERVGAAEKGRIVTDDAERAERERLPATTSPELTPIRSPSSPPNSSRSRRGL